MTIYFEKIPITDRASFYVKELHMDQFDAPRHFHPEYEIMFVKESWGKRFVGDNISIYQPQDLILLGPNLPHYWYNESSQKVKATVIQFPPDFLDLQMLQKPELKPIKSLMQKAMLGLTFNQEDISGLSPGINRLKQLQGFESFMELLQILHYLASCKQVETLVSPGYQANLNPSENERINRIYNYILKNYQKDINLDEAADLAHLNKSAFCHYFKKRTRKKFSAFVNEVRVGHASRLLMETNKNISEIAFASGFKNLSNFNRRFKEINHISPMKYRGQFNQEKIAANPNFSCL